MMVQANLKRKDILRGRTHILLLLRKGKTYQVGHLRVRYLTRPSFTHDQVLIVVPKKQLRKACKRQKLKRRMREAYRLARVKWSTKPPWYHIAFLHQSSDRSYVPSYEQVRQAITQTLAHIKKNTAPAAGQPPKSTT